MDTSIHRISRHLKKQQPDCLAPFQQLIAVVRANSSILSFPHQSHTAFEDGAKWIMKLTELVPFHFHWQKPVVEWPASGGKRISQFHSLIDHLFVKYPVPRFMYNCWNRPVYQERSYLGVEWMKRHLFPGLRNRLSQSLWEQKLFILMGKGFGPRYRQNLLPIPMSKGMVPHFMNAPEDLDVFCALRWSQILNQGCDEQLARVLLKETFLEEPTTDETYWDHVFQFLVEHGPIEHSEAVEIVDFLIEQRFDSANETWEMGAGTEPLQPDLSLRGRTLQSVRRMMKNWREDIIAKHPELLNLKVEWKPVSIGTFHLESQTGHYTIEELLTDKALKLEGTMMKHCVGSYTHECLERKTSIWSMRFHTDKQMKRLATIEVDPGEKLICTVSAKCNETPKEPAITILKQWANQEGLTLDEYVI